MDTVAGFIRRRVAKLESEMDKMAHDLAGGGRDYESYLIGVGKYRQMKSERDGWQEQLKRMAAADAASDEDEPEEIEEPTTRAPVPRPQRPRAQLTEIDTIEARGAFLRRQQP